MKQGQKQESKKTICLINGSRCGAKGNSAQISIYLESLIKKELSRFRKNHNVHWNSEFVSLNLAERLSFAKSFATDRELQKNLRQADGFVFLTGTYWDSWGSPLQKFFEDMTEFECGELWLNKPATAVVSMHSVGGKEVLSRLIGVLNTLGLWVPPVGGLVLSAVNELALNVSPADSAPDLQDDLWRKEDLRLIAHNLLQALHSELQFRAWPVDRKNTEAVWFKK